ncbi:4-hydroxy-tetrahydrodipicolinate synthase [Enterococcus sp. DIV2402]|uniref:4-hydroxy-tetrahydrodipicolinate synthase n=1 Tax=Candidatus Enterococcus lowellii TaxID=2230877 RepID=A0ABZ2SNE1_9ENTE|nr:dihydrodipicolinate synthase family protein [Enterococcus sp. DIV2402]MBO0463919.1 dihydrodipicolinate synthase family protein [Enterococcus sp. DIV2402]
MKTNLQCAYHIAVPTAFFKDEELNVSATIQHVSHLQRQGVSSVLICGSTGEQHSLTLEEKLALIEGIEQTVFPESFEILFGVASIRQKEAELLAQAIAHSTKIAGVLLGFPPYILPTQQEAKAYVLAIAKIIQKPIILYNNPKRTGFDLAVATMNELMTIPQLIGLKEAGVYQRISQFHLPKNRSFYFYAGGEANLAEKITLGFTRLSSIGGNLYPKEMEQWFQELLAGKNSPFCHQEALDELFSESVLPALKQAISENEGIKMGSARLPLGNT